MRNYISCNSYFSFGTGLLGINNTKFLKRYSPKEVLFSVAFFRNFARRSRGVSGLFNLPQSTDSIKSHLCLIHLSKESFTEGELIFARAGLFDVEDSVMAKCGSAQSIGTLMGSSGAKVQRASIRHTLVAIPKG